MISQNMSLLNGGRLWAVALYLTLGFLSSRGGKVTQLVKCGSCNHKKLRICLELTPSSSYYPIRQEAVSRLKSKGDLRNEMCVGFLLLL